MAPIRLVSILVVCLAVPLTAFAQGIATSYRELTLLVRPGDTVTITDTSGQRVSGKITDLSPSSLALMVDGQPREWRESDVATVTRREADSLFNGALIGLAAGAGTAAVTLAAVVHHDSYDGELSTGQITGIMMLTAAGGAGLGLGIDAGVTRQRVVFQRRTLAMSVSPLLGPARAGGRLTIGF